MWTYVLDHYLDLVAFCTVAILATAVVHRCAVELPLQIHTESLGVAA